MRDDLTKRVNRGVAWVGLASSLVAVFDLVSLAVILHTWVTKEQLGVVTVVTTAFGALNLVAEVGLPSAVVRIRDPDETRLSTVFWLGLASGGVVYAIVWSVAPVVADAYGEPLLRPLFRTLGLMLLLRPFYTTHAALLRRELRFAELSSVRIAANTLELATKIGTAAAGAGVWCFVLAPLARELVYAIGVPLRSKWRPGWTFQPRRVAEYFRFGLRSTGGEVVFQLYSNFDYQVVGWFFGPVALGTYRAAYELVLEPVRFVSGVVTVIAFPTFARLRGDRRAIIEQFIAFTRQNLVIVLILVSVILVSANELLVLVFGAEYGTAAGAARILAIVGVLRAMSHLGPPLLDGVGRPDLSLRYQLTAAAVLCTAFVVSANIGSGIEAVAVGWAIGYPIAFGVLSWMVLSQLELDVRSYLRRVGRIIGLVAIAAVAGELVMLALGGLGPLARMTIASSVVVGLGFALLGWFEAFSPRAIVRSLRG